MHKQRLKLPQDVAKVIKKVHLLQDQKEKAITSQSSTDTPVANAVNEVDDSASLIIDSEIENLCEQAPDLWERCKDHALISNYGHYIQLKIGLMSFYSAFLKFLSPTSKQPHGRL